MLKLPNILRGEGPGRRGPMHIGEGQMLYISIFIESWGGGDSWVWRVEIGSKVGGSAENFGHIGDRTHAKNLLCRLGVR